MEKIKLNILYVAFICSIILLSCNSKNEANTTLKQGVWRAEIYMQQDTLPFNFEILKDGEKYRANLINGDTEVIPLDDIEVLGDSVFITLHIFDIELRAKINDTVLNGLYIKNYKDNYRIPFKAKHNNSERFINSKSTVKFDGKWQVNFVEDDTVTFPGVGIFKKDGDLLKGTFLTETGDYRYLEGTATDSTMSLYTFDGNHAFIFNATTKNDSIKGEFLSGMDYRATFSGYKNANAKLTDADNLTFLKDGYDKIEFSFPGLDGKNVSLDDEKYKNKVVLLQIFGTWCPNCMDETIFYTDWYSNNKNKGVEIIGLAYEAKDDFEYAKARVEKMKSKYNVEYDYVIAGVYDKEAAAKTLPMLNHVLSFPTTIFIDKKGKVRKIHTGFSGPATGSYYEEFKENFNSFMEQLLNE